MTFDDTITRFKEQFERATYDRPIEHVYAAVHRRQRRRRLSLRAVATTAAVVLLIVVWAPFATKQAAIAGWTPQSQATDPATLNAADPVCRSLLSPNLTGIEAPGWSDLRGNGLLIAYPTDTAVGVCMQIDHGHGFVAEGAAGVIVDLEPLTGVLRVDSVAGFDHGGAGVTAVVGQASPDVTRIVVTAPGWTADASQHNGYWLAWWPAATDATNISVAAFDTNGDLLGTWSPNR